MANTEKMPTEPETQVMTTEERTRQEREHMARQLSERLYNEATKRDSKGRGLTNENNESKDADLSF
jgi:hypothetical protein